jgi:hypothetical protein
MNRPSHIRLDDLPSSSCDFFSQYVYKVPLKVLNLNTYVISFSNFKIFHCSLGRTCQIKLTQCLRVYISTESILCSITNSISDKMIKTLIYYGSLETTNMSSHRFFLFKLVQIFKFWCVCIQKWMKLPKINEKLPYNL